MSRYDFDSDAGQFRRPDGTLFLSRRAMINELNKLLDRAEAAESREAKLREALEAIVKRPDGCPWCDSGVLRNPEKGHGPDCGFAKADALAASPAPCTHNTGVYQFEGDFRCKGCDAPMPDDAGKKKEGAAR